MEIEKHYKSTLLYFLVLNIFHKEFVVKQLPTQVCPQTDVIMKYNLWGLMSLKAKNFPGDYLLILEMRVST